MAFCFQVDEVRWRAGPGFFVPADPDPQRCFAGAECAGDAGDYVVRTFGIILGVRGELYSALLALIGVLGGGLRIPFPISSPPLNPGRTRGASAYWL